MRLAAIMALISCLPAFGEPVMYPDGRIRDGWPTSISGDGWATSKPSADLLASAGYRLATADEIEAQAASDLAAETNAQYQASLPVQEPRGFEVPYVVFLDSTNRSVGVAMELTADGDPIIYEFHASPVDWAKVDSNRAAAAKANADDKAAIRAARAKGQIQQRLEAIENHIVGKETEP